MSPCVRRLLAGTAIASVLTTVHVLSRTAVTTAATRDADPYEAFCLPPPRAAVVGPSVASDRVIGVAVPRANPDVPVLEGADATTTVADKGAVIEFKVTAGREGALAVHGLSDLVVLQAGTATVRFRAIHAGRFPLHFHGADRSHFEIAVLEVRP